MPASAAHTPVDLPAYASWQQEPATQIAAAGGGARGSFARRAVLDLPIVAAAASAPSVATPGAEFEPVSPLDVPAFLRRQSEG